VLGKRLKSSAVIHIGRQLPNDATFHTLVHLLNDRAARKLPRRKGKHAAGSGRDSGFALARPVR
jgi:hypothetical protein